MDEDFTNLSLAFSGLFLDGEQQKTSIALADRHYEAGQDPNVTPKAPPVPLPAELSPEPVNVAINPPASAGKGFTFSVSIGPLEWPYLTVPEGWPDEQRVQVHKFEQIPAELFEEELKRFGETKDKVKNWLQDQRTGRSSRRYGVGGYGSGYQ